METASLAGHFIIAMPTLMESYFDQSVTYMCEHDENGAFGIVINHQTNITLNTFLSDIQLPCANSLKPEQKLFIGGPVQQDHGFILHKADNEWESTLKIDDKISLSTSRDILEAIAKDSGPKQHLIALGYAGWAPGQLEQEFLDNAWLSCAADEKIIFSTPVKQRFQAAADIIGVNMSTISNQSGRA